MSFKRLLNIGCVLSNIGMTFAIDHEVTVNFTMSISNSMMNSALSEQKSISKIVAPQTIKPVLNQFQLKNPTIIIDSSRGIEEKKEILRAFSKLSQQITFNQNISIQSPSYIIFTSLKTFEWTIFTESPILVITEVQNESELEAIDVSINIDMNFMDIESLKVYETYNINNKKITKYLGQFEATKSQRLRFSEQQNVLPIARRRANFHGIQLNAMVELEPPIIMFPDDYASRAPYFPNNQTYDMTEITTGYFMHVLKSMEQVYNFTTKLYKRKDGVWGFPKKMSNGSFAPNGMLQNLDEGSAEFAWVPLAILQPRMLYADYMPVLVNAYGGLFIPAKGSSEGINWTLFLGVFTLNLWQALIVSTVVVSIVVFIFEWIQTKKVPVSS